MITSKFCTNYFSGLKEICNYKNNDKITNAVAFFKVATVFTVLLPICFLSLYTADYLYGRITKKESITLQDNKVNQACAPILVQANSPTQSLSKQSDITLTSEPVITLSPVSTSISNTALNLTETIWNYQLAQNIIAKHPDDHHIEKLCSGDFLIDPVTHLIRQMISRGVGGCMPNDYSRGLVISQIPDFVTKISSASFLKKLANKYFNENRKFFIEPTSSNEVRVRKVFEKSLSSFEFQKDLAAAIFDFNKAKTPEDFIKAENALRIPLTIFDQAIKLQPYTFPQTYYEERAEYISDNLNT